MRNILWVLGIGAVIWVGAHAGLASVAPMRTAFRATGAEPSGYSVNDWVEVAHGTNLRPLARQTGNQLHLSNALHETRGATYHKVMESQTQHGVTTKVIVERLTTGSTFVVADRTSPHGFKGLGSTESLFTRVLGKLGHVHTDINLEGRLKDHLSQKQEQKVAHQALSAIAASGVTRMATKGYVSMSAKSPFVSGSDQLQGHAVNVQVAASYNPNLHETQVYVGSPLITVTY